MFEAGSANQVVFFLTLLACYCTGIRYLQELRQNTHEEFNLDDYDLPCQDQGVS
jgi:hypothetical protein